jgi:WD40 repeat protein
VYYLAFDPAGARLATVSEDLRVMVWECRSGRLLATLDGFEAWAPWRIRAVSFSPDGKRLITAGFHCIAWDLAPRSEFLELPAGREAAVAVRFSPDGALLASASRDRGIGLWDGRTGAAVRAMRAGAGEVSDLAFSPRGEVLASAHDDGAVRLWSPADGRELRVLQHAAAVRSIAFSPSGERLVAANSGRLALWEVASGKLLAETELKAGAVEKLAFVLGGDRVVAMGSDGTVKLWGPDRPEVPPALHARGRPTTMISPSPDGKLLAAAVRGGSLLLVDAADGAERLRMRGPAGAPRSLAWSPDGRRLACGLSDGKVGIWDCLTGRRLLELVGHRGEVLGLAFSPDGERLASACADGTVRLWLSEEAPAAAASPSH